MNPRFVQDKFLKETELVFGELGDCIWELEYRRHCVLAGRHYASGVTAASSVSVCVELANSVCKPETVSNSAELRTRSMFKMSANFLPSLPMPAKYSNRTRVPKAGGSSISSAVSAMTWLTESAITPITVFSVSC